MSQSTPIPKYRPVLTAAQITHILSLCKSDLSDMSVSVIASLSVFEYKIRNEVITPAYTQTPKPNLFDSMGLNPMNTFPDVKTKIIKENRELRKSALYAVWSKPENQSLRDEMTIEDLKLVQEYRYENNLMSKEEETQFEASMFHSQSK